MCKAWFICMYVPILCECGGAIVILVTLLVVIWPWIRDGGDDIEMVVVVALWRRW